MNNKVLFSRRSDDWKTPEGVYAELDSEFDFDDDPCPVGATDGLIRSWGKNVFVNPPYSNIRAFLEKALIEIQAQHTHTLVFFWFQAELIQSGGTKLYCRMLQKSGSLKGDLSLETQKTAHHSQVVF